MVSNTKTREAFYTRSPEDKVLKSIIRVPVISKDLPLVTNTPNNTK